MHILILPSWYPSHPDDINGVFFRDQARALVEKGHKVGVISVKLRSLRTIFKSAKDESEQPFEVDEGILTYRDYVWKLVSRLPYVKYWLWRLGANRILKRYIAEQGLPDIIHAHSAIYGGKVAAEWGERFGIAVVLTEHSSRFANHRYKKWQLDLARAAATGADARIAVSPPLGEVLGRQLGHEVGPWRWIPNMVASRFSDTNVKKPRREGQPPRLLNLARMHENKGHEDLLKAFAKAFPAPSQVELWLGGDGRTRQQLEEKTLALGVSDRVRFLGQVTPADVPSLLAEVDMFVFASHYETFGVVVAEALTVGVPVVSTRCGGPEYIIQDGDGALVERRSADALARVMKEQLAQLSSFDRVAIRERALARFSGSAVAGQLETVYQQILAGEYSE